jgi:hypothetical protein
VARIKGIEWKRDVLGRDLHVLPGQSTRPLPDDLRVRVSNLARPPGNDDLFDLGPYLTAHADTTFEFRPLYNATLVGDLWNGDGLGYTISVHRKTGVVTIGSTVPAVGTPAKRNFIVEAILSGPERVFREVIRIQIHHAVKAVWLTPPELTAHLGSPASAETGVRFSVRVEFDDELVGDVTLNHGVTWTTSPAGRVTADGFLHPDAVNDAVGAEIDVMATLPATLASKTAKGTLKVGPPWATAPLTAAAITGGAAGVLKGAEQTPNVLFVSGGFEAANQPIFEKMTDLIVDRLRTDDTTRPFDLLTPSINFWRTFVPSTPGVSIREEVYEPFDGNGTYVRPMPPALRPPAGPWKQIEYLVYAVGLPTLVDAGTSIDDLRTEWTGLVAAEHAAMVADATIVTDTLIKEWRSLATRRMVDEIDGFPGVAMGEPPAARVRGTSMLTPHPDRGGAAELLTLVGRITAPVIVPGATRLGDLWAVGSNPAWRFDSQGLIVLLSSYPGGRPLNMHPPMTVGTGAQRDGFPAAKVPGRNAYALAPIVPPGVHPQLPRVIAHEVAHSFGLGDEYREFKERDPQYDDRDLVWYSNLQYVTAAESGGPGDLRASLIKWNWHRIRKAAVVAGPITSASPGVFDVPVDGGGDRFAVGDPVLLRTRAWAGVLGDPPPVVLNGAAHEARVVAPIEPGVVHITASPTTFLSAPDLTPFTPGSLIYMPVPAPASVFHAVQYPYAELIAKNIRDYIDTQHKPMTAVPCAPEETKVTVTQPLLPGVALKAGFCGLCSPSIVGLYEGGNRYACGVFRPTGACNMGPSEPSEYKAFCAVCRYVLVDAIDPTQHGVLDRDYELVYPL